MKTTLTRIFVLLALAISLSGAGHIMRFYPTHSTQDGKSSEGIYLRSTPSVIMDRVQADAEVDGDMLSSEGVPDDTTGFMATPIGSLDTYRIIRLSITIKDRTYQIDHPKAGEALGLP